MRVGRREKDTHILIFLTRRSDVELACNWRVGEYTATPLSTLISLSKNCGISTAVLEDARPLDILEARRLGATHIAMLYDDNACHMAEALGLSCGRAVVVPSSRLDSGVDGAAYVLVKPVCRLLNRFNRRKCLRALFDTIASLD